VGTSGLRLFPYNQQIIYQKAGTGSKGTTCKDLGPPSPTKKSFQQITIYNPVTNLGDTVGKKGFETL